MARVRDWLVAALVLRLGRGHRRLRRRGEEPRLVPKASPDRRTETATLLLLACSSVCAIGFVVVYAVDSIPRQTQFLGLSLGLALLFFAAALIVVGKRLVPAEELAEDYPTEHPLDQELVAELVEQADDGLTRGRLLKLGLLGAGGALGLAAITPALSLGPLFEVREFFATPWRRGRRLVDESGRPYRAADIEERAFYTAFPEGADQEDQASPIVVVRVPRKSLNLPSELAGYDANGVVAYSKVCTHAGCAISLYRTPNFPPAAPSPALVCPCHYSTFDVTDGGTVLFGPAGRKLPMLPLRVDGKGYLRAKGTFDEAVGPSWWGVRNRKPTS